MPKRMTIEIDEELLKRAKRVLGCGTTRATVEAALRRAADQAEGEMSHWAAERRRYLERLHTHCIAVLASDEMWK